MAYVVLSYINEINDQCTYLVVETALNEAVLINPSFEPDYYEKDARSLGIKISCCFEEVDNDNDGTSEIKPLFQNKNIRNFGSLTFTKANVGGMNRSLLLLNDSKINSGSKNNINTFESVFTGTVITPGDIGYINNPSHKVEIFEDLSRLKKVLNPQTIIYSSLCRKNILSNPLITTYKNSFEGELLNNWIFKSNLPQFLNIISQREKIDPDELRDLLGEKVMPTHALDIINRSELHRIFQNDSKPLFKNTAFELLQSSNLRKISLLLKDNVTSYNQENSGLCMANFFQSSSFKNALSEDRLEVITINDHLDLKMLPKDFNSPLVVGSDSEWGRQAFIQLRDLGFTFISLLIAGPISLELL